MGKQKSNGKNFEERKDNKKGNPNAQTYSKSRRGNKGTSDTYRNSETSHNSIEWYTKYKDLVNSAANIPFPYVPGRRLNLGKTYGDTVGTMCHDVVYPGICVFDTALSVGRSVDVSSPINVSARELYAKVRNAYSGSLDADAPDIMMYVLAVDSMFAYIEEMKKVYYTVNMVTPYNNYMPKALLHAMGYDYESVLANKIQLQQYIVEAIALASKFRVPAFMPLIERHQFLFANVFADRPTEKAQLYAFKPTSLYRFAIESDENGIEVGMLDTFYPFPAKGKYATPADMWDNFMSMLDALTLWDTSYTILGYLMRAYADEAMLIPSPLVLDGVLSPVFNLDILEQIQNATIMDAKNLEIHQSVLEKNVLISKPAITDGDNVGDNLIALNPQRTFLTMSGSTQPTPDRIIYATRLHTVLCDETFTLDSGWPVRAIDGGTEILTSMRFVHNLEGSVDFELGGNYVTLWNTTDDDIVMVATGIVAWMTLTSYSSTYNWFPVTYLDVKDVSPAVEEQFPWLMNRNFWNIDNDNLTIVGNEEVSNLHRMCIYSLFDSFR